jgi:transketolase
MTGELHDPRKTFGAAVTAAAGQDDRIVVLSADSGGSSGLSGFLARFPERYLEFGIEEQGVTGVASGLATMGKIPVFCAIAPFVTCRNFEQFRNDLGYMKQNVKIVGRNGGFTYSDLGATHHSLEDYAIMRMIPGVTVLAPQDAGEIQGAVRAMLRHEGPVYMRIGSSPVPQLFPVDDFVIGKGRRVRQGSDATVITTGYTTISVLEAVDALIAEGLQIDLLCLGTVTPLDDELILESARRTGHVITVEEHYARGGLFGEVAELLSRTFPVIIDSLAVPLVSVPSGPYEELLRSYGLDTAGLETEIRALVSRRSSRNLLEDASLS